MVNEQAAYIAELEEALTALSEDLTTDEREAGQIDETSKKRLGAYITAAAKNVADRTADATIHDEMMGAPGTSRSALEQEHEKIAKRQSGIAQAVRRLTR